MRGSFDTSAGMVAYFAEKVKSIAFGRTLRPVMSRRFLATRRLRTFSRGKFAADCPSLTRRVR
jgi:hypothetical protein